MKKYIGFLVFICLVFGASLVSTSRAEDGSGSEDDDSMSGKIEDNERDEAKDALKLEREAKKDELKKERDVLKDQFKTDRDTFKEKAKTEREDLSEKTKEEREAVREKLKTEREVFRDKIKTERDAFIEKLKIERDVFMTELKARKEEWKNARSEKKLEFCEKAKEAFSGKFTEAISKLGEFQTRVNGVIVKLEAEGKDTVAAKEALALSKTKLADAKTKLDAIKNVVPENSCENMTPELFEQIKLQAREAKDLLKESKNYLHDSIKELKTLRGIDDDSNDEDESADDNGVDAESTDSADDNGTDTN